MPKAILFVDDDREILNALKRNFFRSGFKIHLAEGGNAGLEILSREPVDLVVSDMRMPGMNGYDFLKAVCKGYPDVLRVILSGYTDKDTILKSVMDGTACAYITKPWDNEALEAYLRHLIKMHDAAHSKRVLEKISKIKDVPVLPAVYYKLTRLIREDRELDEIRKTIEEDPGYTAKILNLANAAFFGGKIGSLKQALMMMGRVNLMNLILSGSVFSIFKDTGSKTLNMETIWKHSNLTNKLLQGFYFLTKGKKIPDEQAAVGLLHDIGYLFLMKYYPAELDRLAKHKQEPGNIPVTEREKELIGASHSEIGAYLLDYWNLPGYFSEVCLYHHEPFNKNVLHKDMVYLAYIADVYSWKALGKMRNETLDGRIPAALNLDPESLEKESGRAHV